MLHQVPTTDYAMLVTSAEIQLGVTYVLQVSTTDEINTTNYSTKSDNATARRNRDNHEKLEEGAGNCPVCRKPFHAKDLDHVLDLVGSHSSRERLNSEVDNEENILQSEDEIIRKQRFKAILSLQKENNGLIEPKKDIVILPGMYLQQPVAVPDSTSTRKQFF